MSDDGEQRRGPGRPATGQTPVRSLRMGHVWDDAKAVADRRGEKLHLVIEAALRRYVARNGGED